MISVRSGSSPLTRGKHGEGVAFVLLTRLIPAHAGKTPGATGLVLAFGAHPRSRGENRSAMSVSTTALGSSPLTRGKQIDDGRSLAGARLIPAHAGKTMITNG